MSNRITIAGQGPTTGAAGNSIQVSDGAAGWVTGNTVIGDIWATDTNSSLANHSTLHRTLRPSPLR